MLPSEYLEEIEYDDEGLCNEMDKLFISKEDVIDKKEFLKYLEAYFKNYTRENLEASLIIKKDIDYNTFELKQFGDKIINNIKEGLIESILTFKDKVEKDFKEKFSVLKNEFEIITPSMPDIKEKIEISENDIDFGIVMV